MRTVVTGGAGFIGSTLVDRLVAEGHEVLVVDDLSSGRRSNLDVALAAAPDRVGFEELDVRDPRCTTVIGDAAPEVVFHLAAQADVRVSVADPVFDAEVNVVGTLRVLEGCRRGGTRKVVAAASGGTLYGEADPSLLPLDESVPHRPASPYGASKSSAGTYLGVFESLYGLQWTELALANVFGPRQDPNGEAGVVAIFAGLLLAGEPCTIYGTGAQTRDFVYVDDVVDAFVRAVDRADGRLCNIGTGVETSVNDLYATMADEAGVSGEAHRASARIGELDRSALDPALAGRELGWRPEVDLTEGVRRTIDWFRRVGG